MRAKCSDRRQAKTVSQKAVRRLPRTSEARRIRVERQHGEPASLLHVLKLLSEPDPIDKMASQRPEYVVVQRNEDGAYQKDLLNVYVFAAEDRLGESGALSNEPDARNRIRTSAMCFPAGQ